MAEDFPFPPRPAPAGRETPEPATAGTEADPSEARRVETPSAEPSETPAPEPRESPTAEPREMPDSEPRETPTAEPHETPAAEPHETPAAEPHAESGWAPLSSPADVPVLSFGEGPGRPPAPSGLPATTPRGEVPALTSAFRGLGLLFASGVSLGMCAWELRARPHLLRYVQSNELATRGRHFLLLDMFGVAFAACALGLLYVLFKRRDRPAAARRLNEIGLRLAPLAMAAFVPLMLDWELWVGRELPFLMLAAIFGLGLQGLGRAAFAAPPLGILRPVARWTRRPRAALERWADRHPRLVASLPLSLVVLGAAGYAAYFGAVTIMSHHNLRTYALDLGLEENLVWNARHWARPFFKSSPLGGPTASHFGFHATFIAYPLSLIYGLAPRAETMLIIQAVMIGAAALPLFLYARRHVGAWTACLLAYVYLLYPPVHGANLYDFHYLPIGVFFLWTSLYAIDARRPVLAVFAIILTLSIREDVGAGLAIIGTYLLLTGQKPRAGLALAAIGAGYFVLLKLIIMPRALAGDSAFLYMYRDLVPTGDNTFGGVLKTAIANPAYTLNTLIERDKLVYLLELMTPLAFLALRRPIGLICCLPGIFFTLLSTGYAPLIQTSFQYTANWTTYLFMAMVGNLEWVSRPLAAGDTRGPARRKAWILALAASTIVGSYQFGAVFQRNTIRGGFGTYVFGTSPLDVQNRKAVRALVAEVPPRAKIVASEPLVPQVSNRPDAYTLRIGTYDADYLLFGLPIGGYEQLNALPLLQSGAFGVLDVKEPFVLAKRGAPTVRNAMILARMR